MRAAVLGAALALALPTAALGAFQDEEARNYSKIAERGQHEHQTPEYKALMTERSAEDEAAYGQELANDAERNPSGICEHHYDACAGDVRLYKWAERGYGITKPVIWTARNGATIAGHVWATRFGPPRRPAVVITTGSVQAPYTLYLFAATTLAKRGYVVLTYDVQGQGRSDTYGEGADRNENVPFQQPSTFVDGTEDALDFLLSTRAKPYRPRRSRTTGTDHYPKQKRRVGEGRNAAFNPLHAMIDPKRVGIVGHSLGAFAVSQVGTSDKRVDALVAWDNLSAGGGEQFGQEIPPFKLRVPALGMSNDYGLTPTPYGSAPNPQAANSASRKYSERDIATAQLNIRGGTHYEYSYIPSTFFGATLRGMDMAAWYTHAWLDKYVKRGDPTADRRLLTNRWRADKRGSEVDLDGDGNLFSKYLRSRVDFRRTDGSRARCEDLRAGGCGLLRGDGLPPNYSYLREALTKDRDNPPTSSRGLGACARSVKAPRKLDLSGSRRVKVKLRLLERTRLQASVRTKSRKKVRAHSKRTLKPGRRKLTLRLRKGARAGRHTVNLRLRCASGLDRRRLRLKLAR